MFVTVYDVYNSYITMYFVRETVLENTTLDNAKQLAALVDYKLTKHYDMDDNSKKKVRRTPCLLSAGS